MSNLVQELARFAVDVKFEELPENVVHVAKRILLDSIGCALAGLATDKGKMSVALARRLGGPPESSVIGAGDRVSCSAAALANGESILASSYCPLVKLGAHVPPHAIPAPLAMAESVDASGTDLILATVLAIEIGTRVQRALRGAPAHFDPPEYKTRWSASFGHAGCNFGAAAGAGRILKLDQDKMSNALGIAGHLCQVPIQVKFLHSTPGLMTNYSAPGWQSTGAVIAVLWAQMGCIGDITVFDTEYGFWRFSGSERWEPDSLMDGLGEKWLCLDTWHKAYPNCAWHFTEFDCFTNIIEQNNLMPEEIESVKVFGHPSCELPLYTSKELVTQIDAEFNIPYSIAVAAHRVRVGMDWTDWETMRNPKILAFMKKVSTQTHPEYGKQDEKHPFGSIGAVEVVANGKTYREEKVYARGAPVAGEEFTDEELVEKFKHNASRILTKGKIERAVKALLEVETLDKVSSLMKEVTL